MHHSVSVHEARRARLRFALGVLLVGGGLVTDTSTLAVLSSDGQISGFPATVAIAAAKLVLIVSGVLLLLRPWSRRSPAGKVALALALLGAFWLSATAPVGVWRQRQLLAEVNRSEDLIQWLTTKLPALKASAMNLVLPDARAARLFADEVAVVDLAPSESKSSEPLPRRLGEVHKWSVTKRAGAVARAELELWRPLLATVDHFEFAKFYIVRGDFGGAGRFDTDVGFAGVAQLASGEVAQVAAKLHLTWRDHTASGAKEPTWLVHEWDTATLEVVVAERPMFAEVLDRIVPDAADRRRARQSLHEQLVLKASLGEVEPPWWFQHAATDRHPGVAIVDLDRDGLDDLYLMAQWGANMLLRQRGDGTFEDIAPEVGLDIADHTTSAVFADFDNDGDADVFLGRTMAPSAYLVNENGRFVDRSEELIDARMPYLVSSVAAADYDGDGLLDVYFSTEAQNLIMPDLLAEHAGLPVPPSKHQDGRTGFFFSNLTRADAVTLHGLYVDGGHAFLGRPGPPNLLLKNRGGGAFGVAPCNADVQVWRNTFQATFADYDRDGDPDVYLANDFAPNNMLRNDGGRFVDVTGPTDTADLGFGMGATWGDYDNDGAEDLYVTNMFSKAGRRITAQIAGLDPRFARTAGGNSLFRNGVTSFAKVSGMESPAMLVEKVGWSWGAQFLDFDNDGHLDIYAPSGYYTAPAQLEIPFDT